MRHRVTARLGAFLASLSLTALACGGGGQVDNAALVESMQYLHNLSEVSWVEFDGGDIYVGFNERPPDLAIIVNSAIATAAKAHPKPVHIWAVSGGAAGWRPGDGPVFCEAAMRMGMLEKACGL